MSTDKGFVYVLKLQDHCFYVGFSQDLETRIATHFMGKGSQWTRLHPPIGIESIQPGDEAIEQLTTIALMAQRGWEKVRGGRHVAITLPSAPPAVHKALAFDEPPPLPEPDPIEIIDGNGVVFRQLKDNGPNAWRARISGSKAAETCPCRGFKTLYGETLADLRAEVLKWLAED